MSKISLIKQAAVCPKTLQRFLNYDPETGLFVWNERGPGDVAVESRRKSWNKQFAGKPAFYLKGKQGYLFGYVCNKIFFAHRVAWAISTGEWPQGEIDHINHVRDDNRLVNLRVVTTTENNRSRLLIPRSISGHIGVNWNKKDKRWIARHSYTYLGSFISLEDAVAARSAFVP